MTSPTRGCSRPSGLPPGPDHTALSMAAPAGAQRADAEVLARQHACFASSPLAASLIEAMPSKVLILNRHRQTVFANRELVAFLGLRDAREVLGKRPGELWDCRHASAAGGCGTTPYCNFCGAVEAIFSTMQGKPAASDCSITPRGGARQRVDLRVWTSPIECEGERFTLFVFADIGDERRRRALEHIFFHDVLNTAGTISGAAQLLEEADGHQRPMLEQMITSNSKRLIDEIKAQRDLLAAETGELICDHRPLDAAELLREQAEAYATHPVSRQRRIELADDTQPVRVVTDRTLLGRVIANMIKNALEASVPGQTVTLASRYADGDASVRFEVHNPTYMPRAVQMQVFDRSFSTKGVGRGIGTYSIKLLTERYLGGEVAFSSSEEHGTTFWITIPRSPAPDGETTSTTQATTAR